MNRATTLSFAPLFALCASTLHCGGGTTGNTDASDVATGDVIAVDAAGLDALATDAPGADAATDSVVVDAVVPNDVVTDAHHVDAGPDGSVVTQTLFGAAFEPATTAAGYAAMTTLFGGLEMHREFDGSAGIMPYLNSYQALDLSHHVVSAYSFKYTPSEVTAGMHDTELRSFFQGISDDHPVYYTYWHEPDDELYRTHMFTPTDYRAAWAHIRSIADSVVATRPHLQIYATLIIMEYSMRPAIAPMRPLLGPNGMYPGDAVIDVFGVDTYNDAPGTGGITDAATQFGKVIDFAEAHHKPWAIGELGSCAVAGNPAGRATYLTNAIRYWISRGNTPVYASYFNVNWPSCDYRLESDAPAAMVWRTAMTMGLSAF